LAEFALRKDGLPLSLLFSADSQVQGNGHGLIALVLKGCKVTRSDNDITHSAGREMQGGVTTLPATIHDYRHRPFVSAQSPAVARSAATPGRPATPADRRFRVEKFG
jgi:hypothetical protein